MYNPLDPEIIDYCIAKSDNLTDLLKKIERETHIRTLSPQMISGPILGRFYGWMVNWIKPTQLLEVGTFTGYTTISLAQRIDWNAQLDTIEVNPESHWLANEFFKEYQGKCHIHSVLGNALEVIPTLNKTYDFILIDAGKKDNLTYYELLLPFLNPNGIMVIDNTLWKGKVLLSDPDKKTKNIQELNDIIARDTRVEKMLLPIDDGITIIQKR